MDDEAITKAVMYPPDLGVLSKKLFGLMQDTVDSCYIVAGMGGSIISIDQDKMEVMAERRGIDLARYDVYVRKFIRAFIKNANKGD